MARYEIAAEMNLQNLIKESREVAQALNEFADNLERIEKKYVKPNKESEEQSEDDSFGCITCKYEKEDMTFLRCRECKPPHWENYEPRTENRYCDCCGKVLTKENNKCGYNICDNCNADMRKENEVEE